MAISLLYGKPQRNTDFAAVEYFAAGLFTSIMQVQPPQIRSINTLFVCKGALIYRHVTLCRSDSVALLLYIFLFTGTVSLIDLFKFFLPGDALNVGNSGGLTLLGCKDWYKREDAKAVFCLHDAAIKALLSLKSMKKCDR